MLKKSLFFSIALLLYGALVKREPRAGPDTRALF